MISHVALIVSDLPASEAFYLAALGPLGFSKADAVPGEYIRLTNGEDAVLVLLPLADQYSEFRYHRRGVGLNHIAFQAAHRDAIGKVIEAMRARGIAPLGEGRVNTGYRGVYDTVSFEDPDRVRHRIPFGSFTWGSSWSIPARKRPQ